MSNDMFGQVGAHVFLLDDVCQLVLTESSVEEIKLEAFDKDLDSDDFLGRCVLFSRCLINNLYW